MEKKIEFVEKFDGKKEGKIGCECERENDIY